MAERDIAEAFVEARRAGRALPAYPGTRPEDLPAAYRIQDQALALWDRPIAGWKVGKINPPLSDQLGANRLAGPIFADTVAEAAAEPVSMPVFRDGFAAVEAEFMMRLAPQGGPAPTSNAAAREWVDEIRIGIEIASSPYAGINTDGPCVTVSDHGNNAGLVLGAPVPGAVWDRIDEVAVELEIDGVVAGRGTTGAMLDGPFGAVRFLLNNLQDRGIAPQAGWWVSSGAITGVHEIAVGSRTIARFGDLGSVAARVEALTER